MVDFNKLVNRPEIKPEIAALIKRGNITIEEMRDLRANSYEWESLTPALSNEALIERTNQAIDNCPRAHVPAQSYPEAVHAVFAPELIKRLRQLMASPCACGEHGTDTKCPHDRPNDHPNGFLCETCGLDTCTCPQQ